MNQYVLIKQFDPGMHVANSVRRFPWPRTQYVCMDFCTFFTYNVNLDIYVHELILTSAQPHRPKSDSSKEFSRLQ